MGVLEKKSENLTKFEKTSDFVYSIYKTSYFPKPLSGKK